MGFFDYLLPGLAGLSGIVSNKGGKQTSTSNAPTYDPATTNLRNNIIQSTQDSLTQDPNLTGYKDSQISSLNRNSDLEKQKIMEDAALHGVTGPALDAALNAADSRRFAGVTNLNQQVPLQAIQLRQGILQNANSVFSSSPKAQVNTVTQPANKLGGFVNGLAESIAYLHGKGAFGKQPTQPNLPTTLSW